MISVHLCPKLVSGLEDATAKGNLFLTLKYPKNLKIGIKRRKKKESI